MAIFTTVRIICLVIASSMLTYTTSPTMLTDAMERLFSPLKVIKVNVHSIAMMMTIALRFIPTLIDEVDKIMSAQKARGADIESGGIIKRRGYGDAYIACDSAEPKSSADYRALGLPAKEAIKGPGSVDYGMKWLQKRKIVIDRRRTPNAYEEFVNYEYERNKDGDIISGYPDAKNHLIDATRYALERISRRMGVIA